MQQQARTRAVLAALGIPLWAVRREPAQTVPVVSVWGRQDEVANKSPVTVEATEPLVQTNAVAVLNREVSSTVDVSHVKEVSRVKLTQASVTVTALQSPTASNQTSVNQSEFDTKPVRQPFAQPIVANETVHVVQVLRFSLEARVIGDWVVLVSVQALNHPDRNALWKNLNQALVTSDSQQEVGRLDWPLAEGSRWQHNEGAQAALMGFLSRFGTERRIGLMGELPDTVIPERLERLPSLDELLQEPLKKRTLWRLLTGSIR